LDIVFLQTADPFRYKRMLDATARTVLEYCRRHETAYESYIGIKRGYFPWHATFNRMFQLRELLDRGFLGWAVYLDADAYIHDLDFDLKSYLGNRSDRAGIMTSIPGAPSPWCINAGVILLNLAHDKGREIVVRWLESYHAIDDTKLQRMETWDDGESDQSMLYELLDRDASIREAVEYDDGSIINSPDARFVRQLLRSLSTDLETRTRALEAFVASIVDGRSDPASEVVTGLYQAILRRNPDRSGLENYAHEVHRTGLIDGTRFVAAELLESAEYRQKFG
jgi:hypothetical protein